MKNCVKGCLQVSWSLTFINLVFYFQVETYVLSALLGRRGLWRGRRQWLHFAGIIVLDTVWRTALELCQLVCTELLVDLTIFLQVRSVGRMRRCTAVSPWTSWTMAVGATWSTSCYLRGVVEYMSTVDITFILIIYPANFISPIFTVGSNPSQECLVNTIALTPC